jgi:hypothetical protein
METDIPYIMIMEEKLKERLMRSIIRVPQAEVIPPASLAMICVSI